MPCPCAHTVLLCKGIHGTAYRTASPLSTCCPDSTCIVAPCSVALPPTCTATHMYCFYLYADPAGPVTCLSTCCNKIRTGKCTLCMQTASGPSYQPAPHTFVSVVGGGGSVLPLELLDLFLRGVPGLFSRWEVATCDLQARIYEQG